MTRTVFVTGATGFVGQSVVEALHQRGFAISALLRNPSGGTAPFPGYAEGDRVTRGDLLDASALAEGLRGCAAVIHLVGIIAERPSAGVTFERVHFEGTRAVVDAASAAGVRRFVHMSALGTRADAESNYHKTKWKAEEYLRKSGLDFTILRPSMIHGPHGEFMRQAAGWARGSAMPFLFMPYFGRGLFGAGGAGLLQPVYVGDVARAFVEAIDNPKTVGRTYALAGPDRMSWPRMHEAVAKAVVGRRRLTLPIPAWYARTLACVVPGGLLPFNRDQVIMSQEDNVADLAPFAADFGWTPQPFEPLLRGYAGQIG